MVEARKVLELISSRRSTRRFLDRPVDEAMIQTILEAGRWAPSGTNNQPWRFLVVRDPALKEAVAGLTKYTWIITGAPVIIPVFIHKPSMYHATKDAQAMGACCQSMLLMTHALGLGAVWLGEILKNADPVRQALGVDADHELHAVLALGWPEGTANNPGRKPLEQLMLSPLGETGGDA